MGDEIIFSDGDAVVFSLDENFANATVPIAMTTAAIIIFLFRKYGAKQSLPWIGKQLGDRDHTTILHSIKNFEKMLARNPNAKRILEDVEKVFKNRAEIILFNGGI